MKRLNPFGSLVGFLLTILLLIGLGVSLLVNRGLAFSPGAVTSINKEGVTLQGYTSHADFEKRCGFCHDPLRTDLATKCLECHSEINQQLQTKQGIHSKIDNVNQCAECHPEHHGRDFNPTQAAYQLFDHSTTGFSLNWHQENYDASPLQCTACHKDEDFSIVGDQTCIECHTEYAPELMNNHVRDFGAFCRGCHDGVDRMQEFDHSLTDFALEAKHAQVECTGCHSSAEVSQTVSACVDCHEEPAMHKGLFDQNCVTCHTPEGWSPAVLENQIFSHEQSTGFSLDRHQLDYLNNEITCNTCHMTGLDSFDNQTCVDCHGFNDQVFMTEHITQFGTECMNCHDGVDRLSNFDHRNFFPLDGVHATIQCADCHIDNEFKNTPTQCYQCHQEPEIHAGLFGLECEYCHSTQAWSPASLEQHIFPLNHGVEGQNTLLSCDTCHPTNYIEYTCYTCHEHTPDEMREKHLEEGISEQELPACADCHPYGFEEGGSDD